MTVRIIVSLGRDEKSALMRLAEIEKRDERQQAAYLIKEALIRLGLLQPASATPKEAVREPGRN